MNRKILLLLVLPLLALSCERGAPAGFSDEENAATATTSGALVPTEGIYVSGVMNLYLDETTASYYAGILADGPLTKASSVDPALSSINVTAMERIFPDAGEFEPRSRAMGMHRWYRVHYSKAVPVDEVRTTLAAMKGVEVVEAVVRIESCSEVPFFNDPSLPDQWHYYNEGTGASTWKAGADVNVVPVWANFSTGSSKVTAAVIDTGVDVNHEDLKAACDVENSYNFANDQKTITPGSHGTHVAGTIGAVNNNGIGVCGIAGGDASKGIPGVRIISCEVFGADNSQGGFEEAIKWAADHGAVVCNNSWNYNFKDDQGNYDEAKAKQYQEFYRQPNEGEYKSSLKSAIDYFNTHAGMDANGNQVGPMAGGLVVFSAGNNAKPYGSPACYPGSLAVGSVGPSGERAYYSNYGSDWVDIAAPGGDDGFGNKGMILSTTTNNGYVYMEGTSMAAPHVTGVAALVVSAVGGKGFTRKMLIDRLKGGYNRNFPLEGAEIGHLVDAYGAVTYGENNPPDAVTTLAATAKSNALTFNWKVTGKNGVPAAGYLLFYGTSAEAVQAATPAEPGSGVTVLVVETAAMKIGDTATKTLADLAFETSYTAKLIGYDGSLHYGGASNVVTAKTDVNNPPVVTPSRSLEGLSVRPYESLSIDFTVTDPDGHSFTVNYETGSAAESWNETTSGYNLRIVGSKADAGNYTGTVTATDQYGAKTVVKVPYTIRPNEPPQNVKTIGNILLANTGATTTLNLGEYISDPDGETLSFSVANDAEGVVHANVSGGVLHITALGYGLATLTVTGKDARAESASQSFKVLVRESSVEYQAYPNPVVKTLYVATGAESAATDIQVVNAGGTVVVSAKGVNASAFEPATVDMSACAPGRYGLILKFGGKEYRQTIYKK